MPHFLTEPADSPDVQALYDQDLADDGYVSNAARLWAHQPTTFNRLFELMAFALEPARISDRQRGILIAAAASTLRDSYCSLAWGGKLSRMAGPVVAAGVIHGTDVGLSDQEHAIASWTRKIVTDANSTTPSDVRMLRDAGLSDLQIFSVTAFVALRVAYSMINDALGARPDSELVDSLPDAIVKAVTYGRPAFEAVASPDE
ncbi:MAG: hypothetical protein KGQ66_08805 [Acidobacteriota bacterium]|nr:hypothetical protein [Acidobacteriota bacterium]